MPGNIGLPSRNREMRFSRSSSFTRREPRRCAVKGLRRNSPRVRAKLMVGTSEGQQPYADYTAASVAVLSDESHGRKDTLLRDGTLQPGAGKPGLRGADAGPYHRGHRGTQGKPYRIFLDFLCGSSLCPLCPLW